MRLVVDANILVAQLLRERGRELVASDGLELFMAEAVWHEARHELSKRVTLIGKRARLSEATVQRLLVSALKVVEVSVTVVSVSEYVVFESKALRRIPQDPDDWHTVALALTLDAAIWTQDNDFLGCGVPTWTTATLRRHLTES